MSDLDRETLRREAQRMAGKRFLGMLLMAAGGLLALLCGVCTLLFSVGVIANAIRGGIAAGLFQLLIPLIVGGLPTAAGAVLFWVGLTMYRDGRKRRGHPEREFD